MTKLNVKPSRTEILDAIIRGIREKISDAYTKARDLQHRLQNEKHRLREERHVARLGLASKEREEEAIGEAVQKVLKGFGYVDVSVVISADGGGSAVTPRLSIKSSGKARRPRATKRLDAKIASTETDIEIAVSNVNALNESVNAWHELYGDGQKRLRDKVVGQIMLKNDELVEAIAKASAEIVSETGVAGLIEQLVGKDQMEYTKTALEAKPEYRI